ncbi:hypothetical protein [Streptomyces sp. NPDC088400]|uniref:hypothetical protein n=1 Tax=Streptomyces sp. NPDC088400 TaxID=3365861 RepID=UPI0038104311
MTACATETATEGGTGPARDTAHGAAREAARRAEFAITANGAYAARLTLGASPPDGPTTGGYGSAYGGSAYGGGDSGGYGSGCGYGGGSADAWFPERWTLDGPEPYAVPLPLDQPEEPDTDVLPLADGRVLIRRRVADRHDFSLLYPAGRGTGQLPVGAVGCEDEYAELTLLPPSPDGRRAYALSVGAHSTTIWLVAGSAFGPERVAEVPGRCSGGAWLDRTGRILALDREDHDGVVKAVAIDLERGGEATPLLQITDESNDRLLLADPDSGLLLIRSDAPGHDRLGWGVLGSRMPVRFPECLRPGGRTVTPFAVQPGQVLTPESCAVALRIDGVTDNGVAGSWVGVWRPAGRQLHQLPAPDGWLAGAGLWTREGELRLPYATGSVPCGVSRLMAPVDMPLPEPGHGAGAPPEPCPGAGAVPEPCPGAADAPDPVSGPRLSAGPGLSAKPAQPESPGREPYAAPQTPIPCRPIPLQQAPLTDREASG